MSCAHLAHQELASVVSITFCYSVCIQAEAQHLCEGVKDETEVSDGRYGGKPLFIHVTSLLYESSPNVVVC